MGSNSKVYIAGVGYAPSSGRGSGANDAVGSQVSAATKALLDAGVTYDDISRGVRSKSNKHGSAAFKAFDENFDGIESVQDGSEMNTSIKLVKEKGAGCVLTIVSGKSATIAFVFVSEKFLRTHPYLKFSSALLDDSSASNSKTNEQALHNLCKSVWALRGWAGAEDDSSSQSYQLSRADGADVPKWEEVEYKQDGKHRLRYNPAKETKEISFEDFEAVRGISKSNKRKESKVKFERVGGDRAALAKL